jgi:hypothetical protein
LRKAAQLGWSHADLLDGMSWAELTHVWFGGSGVQLTTAEALPDLKAQINARRKAKGLPPMKPAPVPQRR